MLSSVTLQRLATLTWRLQHLLHPVSVAGGEHLGLLGLHEGGHPRIRGKLGVLSIIYREYVDVDNSKGAPLSTSHTHPEECPRGSRLQAAVLDLGLLGEVLGRLDGGLHPLDGEEGGQVGGVGGDHDQGEEPPHARHHPGGDGPGTRGGGYRDVEMIVVVVG